MEYIEKVSDTCWIGYQILPWEMRGSGPSVTVQLVRIATGDSETDLKDGFMHGRNRGAKSLAALRRLRDLLDGLTDSSPCFFVTDSESAAIGKLKTWRKIGDYYVKEIAGP